MTKQYLKFEPDVGKIAKITKNQNEMYINRLEVERVKLEKEVNQSILLNKGKEKVYQDKIVKKEKKMMGLKELTNRAEFLCFWLASTVRTTFPQYSSEKLAFGLPKGLTSEKFKEILLMG